MGDDVSTRDDGANENSGGRPSSAGPDKRRITTKRGPREFGNEQSSTTERHGPRRMYGRTAPKEREVAVTTQEALQRYPDKAMRIANVENNTFNWVSISPAGALDMTHCDFIVRSARDEMRHIIGSSDPTSSSGATEIRTGSADRRTRITWNSCVS